MGTQSNVAILNAIKERNDKSRANINAKNHQALVNKYMIEILGEFPEGISLADLAVNALELMSDSFEYYSKHPITEAFEKILFIKR